jgi:restriction system protein
MSSFGNDSREFAKNKPLTLMDGANLLFLLAKHGYSARVDVVAARARRVAARTQ